MFNFNITDGHAAAYQGDTAQLEKLIAGGLSVDATDTEGGTALHYAAKRGHLSAVGLLLRYGANVNVVTNKGYTPLMMAAADNYYRVVQLLMESGADASLRSNAGYNAKEIADARGHTDTIRVLDSSAPAQERETKERANHSGDTKSFGLVSAAPPSVREPDLTLPASLSDRILTRQQVEELLADNYGATSERIIFKIAESRRPIMPSSLAFYPLIVAKFSEDPKLGMIYGTGSGCALLRESALKKVQAAHQAGQPLTSCQGLLDALQQLGYTIKQDPKLNLDLLSSPRRNRQELDAAYQRISAKMTEETAHDDPRQLGKTAAKALYDRLSETHLLDELYPRILAVTPGKQDPEQTTCTATVEVRSPVPH